jgi:hypothetical protein
MVPAPGTLPSLGTIEDPIIAVATTSIGVLDTFTAILGVINCMENRVQYVASPEEDTDAANKEYVDDRADAAVTYLQGLIVDAVQMIRNLQDQVNNLINTAALEIPSTTYFEFSFSNT